MVLFSCSADKKSTPSITGTWQSSSVVVEGNAVPEYLSEDLEITFTEDGTYEGNLEYLSLNNEGGYNLLNADQLIIESDTFTIQKQNQDTLQLIYQSYSVDFEIILHPKK